MSAIAESHQSPGQDISEHTDQYWDTGDHHYGSQENDLVRHSVKIVTSDGSMLMNGNAN
jgi:hypothetical protein